MKQSQPTYQHAETSDLIRLLRTKRIKKEMIRCRGGLSPRIDFNRFSLLSWILASGSMIEVDRQLENAIILARYVQIQR
jgi:hypothetical protein